MGGGERKNFKVKILRKFIWPTLIYFVLFCMFTWPWITHFRGWFFTDYGDGLQNVWNIWWVNKSVTELHQLPWHTAYLHAPYGVTLLGQTLNPFNGFVAIGLLKFLTLNQAFNAMVIFSFLFAGLTSFWLCFYFTQKYFASLVGGAIFTFSSYHFAHAIGHMQLVSLEFIPLFILLWWKFVKRPRYRLAIGTAGVLLLVLLCDYYYFIYCVATALAIAVYLWRKKQTPPLKEPGTWRPLLAFGIVSAVIVAPLPLALLRANSRDPFVGSHPAKLFSTDVFTPFIDGGFWRFHSLTNAYWHHIHAYVAESSIYLGLTVLTLVGFGIYSYIKHKKIHSDIGFWLGLGVAFGIFSLGPRLKVFGYSINHAPMPYVILEKVVPGLKLSGVPVRMMVMVTLAAAIISAMVLARIDIRKTKDKILMAAFLGVMLIEFWPAPLPYIPVTQPHYVAVLRSLPNTGSVLDDAALSESHQLYHQVESGKPIILGYISRTPQSLITREKPLLETLGRGEYDKLCSEFKLRYFTVPAKRYVTIHFPAVYSDGEAVIYDLKNSPNC